MRVRTTHATNLDVVLLANKQEDDRAGRGLKFLDNYRTTVENIERFPQMYSEVEDGIPGLEIRNAILERFELRVFSVLLEDEAVIVAVIHARRRPRIWHYRINDL